MSYGMKEAVKYFEDMGLPIKNGLIDSENLSEEQVEILEKWEKSTQIEGIMMPQIEDFYKSVLAAISLNPQKDEEGKIKYLLGRGIGVEIALRGNIQGRNEYETNPIYRSHSDFELYDAKENCYTPYFKRVFGGQEYYPPTKTKTLNDIPEGKMDETCEVVDLDGYKILVPNLEILFLDKFIKEESTPRESGYDYELLAERYDLNKDLLYEYLEKYYFKNAINKEIHSKENYEERFERGRAIIDKLNNELDEEEEVSLEEAIDSLNKQMENFRDGNKSRVVYKIDASSYVQIKPEDINIDEQGNINLNEDYINRSLKEIANISDIRIQDIQNKTLDKLNKLFERSEQTKSELGKNSQKKELFSEQEIGKDTINVSSNDKKIAQNMLEKDLQTLQQSTQEQVY